MVKIFMMDQLFMEYLLTIQENVYKKGERLNDQLLEYSEENRKSEQILEKNMKEIERLRTQRRLLNKKNKDYVSLKTRAAAFKCPFCERIYVKIEALEKHIVKTHVHELVDARQRDLIQEHAVEAENDQRVQEETKKAKEAIEKNIMKMYEDKVSSLQKEQDRRLEEEKKRMEGERKRMEAEMKGKKAEMRKMQERMDRIVKEMKDLRKVGEQGSGFVKEIEKLRSENERLREKRKEQSKDLDRMRDKVSFSEFLVFLSSGRFLGVCLVFYDA